MRSSWIRFALYSLIVIVTSGCSGSYRSYLNTLSYAFNPPGDVNVSLEHVKASNADLMYFRYGDQSRAVMVLGFLDSSQYKWVSADNAIVNIEFGRIVRTVGLPNDLLYVTKQTPDPLQQGVTALSGVSWQSRVDWENDEYGYLVQSDFSAPLQEEIDILGHSFTALKITETLTYLEKPVFLRFDQQWHNEYWFDKSSGQLLKSRQRYAPFQPVSEMVFLSRAARLISKGQ